MRIVINRENILEEHGEGPKAIILIREYLDHSGENKVKTLYVAYHGVAIDVCTKDMSDVPDDLRVLKHKVFTFFIKDLSSN